MLTFGISTERHWWRLRSYIMSPTCSCIIRQTPKIKEKIKKKYKNIFFILFSDMQYTMCLRTKVSFSINIYNLRINIRSIYKSSKMLLIFEYQIEEYCSKNFQVKFISIYI